MKAITYQQYGQTDQLQLREVARPEPGPNDVLVKVLAASVNRADWYLLQGRPFPVRFAAGLTRPKKPTLGADVAGVVERCGARVTQFQPGQEVFGDLSATGFGSFAEYVVTKEDQLAAKPSNLSFEQAAALPMAAVTALQGLRDHGKIESGQSVLINGASGGVGSYGLQIARSFGATVTAVCSTAKVEQARQLGAERVIDYKQSDVTQSGETYDLIFDIVGNHTVSAIRRMLKPGGRYVTVAFRPAVLLGGPLMSALYGKKMINMLAATKRSDLQYIAKLAEDGHLQPVIQQTFTLDDVPEALAKMGGGSLSGKLVITL